MKRGTVVLTPFPFTNLSGQKVRPAVVVSRSDRQGRDILLAFITGQQPSTFNISAHRFADCGLTSRFSANGIEEEFSR